MQGFPAADAVGLRLKVGDSRPHQGYATFTFSARGGAGGVNSCGLMHAASLFAPIMQRQANDLSLQIITCQSDFLRYNFARAKRLLIVTE
jgi:hypothetical protein